METLDLNNLRNPDGLVTVFSHLDIFWNQQRKILRVVYRELYFNR